MEAVCLGRLQRLTVWHTGDRPADSWYLDEIIVQQLPAFYAGGSLLTVRRTEPLILTTATNSLSSSPSSVFSSSPVYTTATSSPFIKPPLTRPIAAATTRSTMPNETSSSLPKSPVSNFVTTKEEERMNCNDISVVREQESIHESDFESGRRPAYRILNDRRMMKHSEMPIGQVTGALL
ncbi:unnamed protein product [Protopolystoma xenopodis]|uniref:PLAT domain-containing protein n=1 Tax=Protopolystoma xenopodis TaxID=117903 RepID=A0A448WX57_9PLAT|nr:unnamed protein product [Protopolystoma xenopodis]